MKRLLSISSLVLLGALAVFTWRAFFTAVEPCDYDTLQEASIDYLAANAFAAAVIRSGIHEQKAVELLERIPPASDSFQSLGHEAVIAPTRVLDESTRVKLWPYPPDTAKLDSWEHDLQRWKDAISPYLLQLRGEVELHIPN